MTGDLSLPTGRMANERGRPAAVARDRAQDRGRGRARSERVWRAGLRSALAGLGALAGVCVVFASDPRSASRVAQRQDVRLTATATIQAEPSSEVAVPIQVEPVKAVPQKSFIRLRGLPPSVSLNHGYSTGAGSWQISVVESSTLRASIPPWVSGRYEIAIALVGGDGEQLAETTIQLVISPAPPPASQRRGEPQQRSARAAPPPVGSPDRSIAGLGTPAPSTEPSDRPEKPAAQEVPRQGDTAAVSPPAVYSPDRSVGAMPATPEPTPEEKDRLQKLAAQAERYIAQGERYLLEGNIGVARQFFQRAADAGYAPGAMRLAATYDPAELSRSQVQGIVPNPSEARKWYERARELGAPEAEERLARLSGN